MTRKCILRDDNGPLCHSSVPVTTSSWNSYKQRLKQTDSSSYPDCGMDPQDVPHLVNCTLYRRGWLKRAYNNNQYSKDIEDKLRKRRTSCALFILNAESHNITSGNLKTMCGDVDCKTDGRVPLHQTPSNLLQLLATTKKDILQAIHTSCQYIN